MIGQAWRTTARRVGAGMGAPAVGGLITAMMPPAAPFRPVPGAPARKERGPALQGPCPASEPVPPQPGVDLWQAPLTQLDPGLDADHRRLRVAPRGRRDVLL